MNLNGQEINLLSKGPKFSLSPGTNENTITDINIAFDRQANQIRWKHFRESNPQPSDFLTYPQTRHIYRSESRDELEGKLQRIHHKQQATLKALQPRQKWSNISHTDKHNTARHVHTSGPRSPQRLQKRIKRYPT